MPLEKTVAVPDAGGGSRTALPFHHLGRWIARSRAGHPLVVWQAWISSRDRYGAPPERSPRLASRTILPEIER